MGRANHIVYVGGMQEKANRKHNAKSKARKYAATNVFHATCKNGQTTEPTHLDPMHVFPSAGSRRLRPRLASFDFDALNGAVNKMCHLL